MRPPEPDGRLSSAARPVPELTSARSLPAKAARGLAKAHMRARQRRFLAEGPQAVREALRRPGTVSEIFATPEAADRHRALRQAAVDTDVPWRLSSAELMSSLGDTVTSQGVLAVCRFVDQPLGTVLATRPGLVAVCADVRDPGNAGTVIRCADAAGADAVVLAGTSVDPYNGKCVRATAGGLFHLPVAIAGDALATAAALAGASLQVLATDASGDLSLDDLIDTGRLERPTAWLFGNETRGLPDEVKGLADAVVRVPIYGAAESLNVASAAAVCLYASARVRHHGPRQPRNRDIEQPAG